MMDIILLILWYLTGFFTVIIVSLKQLKMITLGDLLAAFCAGILGPFMIILVIFVFVLSGDDIILYKKKK